MKGFEGFILIFGRRVRTKIYAIDLLSIYRLILYNLYFLFIDALNLGFHIFEVVILNNRR